MMIYLLTKIWQKYKQRSNLVVVAPINIVHHPCLNNLQFNPIIFKTKTFLFHAMPCLMFIIIYSILHKLKFVQMYMKYNQAEFLLINFYVSIILPLNIYLKNPSLRKYFMNDLLNDLCS